VYTCLAPSKLLILKHIFVISALALCVCGLSRPAQAQIYSWRDPNGILVLSNVPHSGASVATPAVIAPVSTPPRLLMSVGSTYEPLIHQHSTLQGVRDDLVRAVIQVESAFNPRAISPRGAMGLMQLMPTTAARFGVLDPFNPGENIRAGVGYLKQLLERYDHNEQLALAAYNAGPLAVDRHGSQIPPYRETQNYVKRISAIGGTTRRLPATRIYKSVEIVDGQPVLRYSNTKPSGSDYQEVPR
jgi:soluble lytic murein transglycosylase-like protein